MRVPGGADQCKGHTKTVWQERRTGLEPLESVKGHQKKMSGVCSSNTGGPVLEAVGKVWLSPPRLPVGPSPPLSSCRTIRASVHGNMLLSIRQGEYQPWHKVLFEPC